MAMVEESVTLTYSDVQLIKESEYIKYLIIYLKRITRRNINYENELKIKIILKFNPNIVSERMIFLKFSKIFHVQINGTNIYSTTTSQLSSIKIRIKPKNYIFIFIAYFGNKSIERRPCVYHCESQCLKRKRKMKKARHDLLKIMRMRKDVHLVATYWVRQINHF